MKLNIDQLKILFDGGSYYSIRSSDRLLLNNTAKLINMKLFQTMDSDRMVDVNGGQLTKFITCISKQIINHDSCPISVLFYDLPSADDKVTKCVLGNLSHYNQLLVSRSCDTSPNIRTIINNIEHEQITLPSFPLVTLIWNTVCNDHSEKRFVLKAIESSYLTKELFSIQTHTTNPFGQIIYMNDLYDDWTFPAGHFNTPEERDTIEWAVTRKVEVMLNDYLETIGKHSKIEERFTI